jgi:integrase
MPRRKSIPTYRLHRQSGQAVVTLSDAVGRRRDVLLGKYDSSESRAEYVRVIGEWEAKGRRLPDSAEDSAQRRQGRSLSINELLLGYMKFAESYYGLDEQPRKGGNLRDAVRLLKEMYGHTQARDFGPLALKACRQQMIAKDWSRTYINAQVDRLRRVFRWGAEEELVPASVYVELKTVSGLRQGKTAARETRKIKPVSPEHVEATLPFMPLPVQAMVQLQLLTGCRPTEVCIIRPLDLEMRSPDCWIYRPGSDQGEHGVHKTAHHGHDRLILIGPRAQQILRPYLGTKLDAYCFNPAQAEEQRNAIRKSNRQTPMTPSQAQRQRKTRPARPKRDHYDVISYRNAIYRACDKAFTHPELVALLAKNLDRRQKKAEVKAWREAHAAEEKPWRSAQRWHPNRLRHTRATQLRPHGLDLTKTVLGHSKVETSLIYAEKDMATAMDLVAKIG